MLVWKKAAQRVSKSPGLEILVYLKSFLDREIGIYFQKYFHYAKDRPNISLVFFFCPSRILHSFHNIVFVLWLSFLWAWKLEEYIFSIISDHHLLLQYSFLLWSKWCTTWSSLTSTDGVPSPCFAGHLRALLCITRIPEIHQNNTFLLWFERNVFFKQLSINLKRVNMIHLMRACYLDWYNGAFFPLVNPEWSYGRLCKSASCFLEDCIVRFWKSVNMVFKCL